MQDVITYRMLTRRDVKAFCELRLYGLRESPQAFLEDFEESEKEPPEAFEKYFDNGWIAGAFGTAHLEGVAGLYIHKGKKLCHKGTVWGVYVLPEARGQRVAKQLVTMVMKEGQAAGLELIQLSTDESNKQTLSLYRSLGFRTYGIERHVLKFPTGHVNYVLMEKFLKE